jgi:hypothetical protein
MCTKTSVDARTPMLADLQGENPFTFVRAVFHKSWKQIILHTAYRPDYVENEKGRKQKGYCKVINNLLFLYILR